MDVVCASVTCPGRGEVKTLHGVPLVARMKPDSKTAWQIHNSEKDLSAEDAKDAEDFQEKQETKSLEMM